MGDWLGTVPGDALLTVHFELGKQRSVAVGIVLAAPIIYAYTRPMQGVRPL
jgi:hypothetical protein